MISNDNGKSNAHSKISNSHVTVTRHYYSQHRRTFETSLDVYTPSSSNTISSIVVLVVGSAWMGHAPWIYSGTSWWNSAGPRSIAQTGSTICICVRHRGAFFHIPPLFSDSISLILCVLLVMSSFFGSTALVSLFAGILCLWLWLRAVGQDAASFLDMQSDVEQAIGWIQENKSCLCSKKDIPIYFGGYSSGAHVAVTVLQRSRSLSQFFQGIVLISGVLAVRPEALPTADLHHHYPRWLTDLLLRIVFGPKDSQTIPSPISNSIPPLPHFILGCEHEVWGLPLLDVFFCSRAYVNKARQHGIPVYYQEIPSDHWWILSHPQLPQTLVTELPRFISSSSSSSHVDDVPPAASSK